MVDPLELVAHPVVNKILSLTSSFIKEQYHLVYGVKHEVVRLNSNLTAIQATLRDVESIPSDTRYQLLQDWLTKLKDAALDAEDVLELYATKALRQSKKKHRLVISPLLRREASQNIKKITERINEICQEKKNFLGRMIQTPKDPTKDNPYGLQIGSCRDISDICGREREKEEMVNWMLSEEFDIEGGVSVLPIIGMAGLGKTTLAQLIYNDPRVTSHFNHQIWIDVTIPFDVEKIGREIIEGITKKRHQLSNWSSVVTNVLQGKLFLVVLDNLWNAPFTDWQQLQLLLRRGKKGSRVVITSQISGVAEIVAARHTHFLDYLPEETCWLLFVKIAFAGGRGQVSESDSRSRLMEIGKQIVQKCSGLPLAVTSMAYLLRGCTDVGRWQRVLKHGIWETELQIDVNGRPNILQALRLCYDRLPSHLKQCFAYCCLFPKGHTFDTTSDLIKLWMAQGLLDSSTGQSLPEETGSDYFELLRSRSFFHPVNVDGREAYRMHHLLHDLATSVSGQSCKVVDLDFNLPTNCRHVSILSKDVQKLSEIVKATKLRTFLLPTNENRDFGHALDKIFKTLQYLRVLDLSSSTLTELPKSIGELQLLRYLDLSLTEIRMLTSSVCKLVNLQTLKLLGCLWLSTLPEDLCNLTNLRHLELDDMFWHKCSSLPPRIGSLTNLQNLHSFPVVRERGCGVELLQSMKCPTRKLFPAGQASRCGVQQLKSMKYLTGKLYISKLENAEDVADANLKEKDRLQELVLEWSEGQKHPQDPTIEERTLAELEPHPNTKVLQICHYKGSSFPTWMTNASSFRTLSKVSLSYCVNIRSISSGLLHHLRELHIKGMLELEEWIEAEYPSLKRLRISNCPKLRRLPRYFQKLRVMKIKSCLMLEDLPAAPSLKSLILIDNIILDNWKEESFSAVETSDADEEAAREPLFSELKVVNCPKLTGLRPAFQPQRLEISACPLLRTLPIPEQNQHLEHLILDRCSDGTLVEVIPSCDSVQSLVLSNIAKLISMPISLQLRGLKALYIHKCEDFVSLSHEGTQLESFTSLKLLSVCDCPQLVTFVPSRLPSSLEHLSIKNCSILESICLLSLIALKDLYLENCPNLKSFPKDGIPSSLKHVCIQGCPLISMMFNNGGSYCQMIADLEVDSV